MTLTEINIGITKLKTEIDNIRNMSDAELDSSRRENIQNNVRQKIKEIFGEESIQYKANSTFRIYSGSYGMYSSKSEHFQNMKKGVPEAITTLESLIDYLEEQKQYLSNTVENTECDFNTKFWDFINPHIYKVSHSRFTSGHYADAVEAAMKQVNVRVKEIYKKKKALDADGATLMNTVFSVNNPIITLEDQSTESGKNTQLGYMQIFAGSMTGIRNPNAHENLNITSERAIHLIFLASLLMFKIDEAV